MHFSLKDFRKVPSVYSLNYIITDGHNNLWVAHSDAGLSVLCTAADPVEIEYVDTELSVNIYPNLTTHLIALENDNFADKKVQIFNTHGGIVLETNEADNTIDVSALPNGIYLLKIISSQ